MAQSTLVSPLSIARIRARFRFPLSSLLLAPAALLYITLLLVPLAVLVIQSLRPHIDGRIGGLSTGWTLANYGSLMHVQYLGYFRLTIVLGMVACVAGMLLAYPVAHQIARTRSRFVRRFWINLLVSSLFLDTLVRCYALALFFGKTGVVLPVLRGLFGIMANNSLLLQAEVVVGLLYLVIPISALTLVGPIENINPRLSEAAVTLGASYWKSLLVTDVALSMPAVWSSFLMTFTICITSFIVPLLLGNGFVNFVAGLIYQRFSENADYPSGAALSILVLVVSLALVYTMSRIARAAFRWQQ